MSVLLLGANHQQVICEMGENNEIIKSLQAIQADIAGIRIKQDSMKDEVAHLTTSQAALAEDFNALKGDNPALGQGQSRQISFPEHQINLTLPQDILQKLGAIGPAAEANAPDRVQDTYLSIQKAYAHIKLHQDLVFPSDKTGIKREDQPTRSLIQNAAKYVETLLQILIDLDVTRVTEQTIDELSTTCVALNGYLKGEQAQLQVKGNFGPNTARVFRQLQKNTTAFTGENLDNVKDALQLAPPNPFPQNQFRGRFNRGGGRPYRGGQTRGGYNNSSYNSGYNSGYNNSGYHSGYNNQRSDFFGNFINREVPPQRYNRGRGRGMSMQASSSQDTGASSSLQD